MTNFIPESKNEADSTGREFAISRLSFARHLLALVLTVLLSFSLLMSELSRFIHNHQIIFSKFALLYIFLIAFSAYLAIKAIVSVKRIKVKTEGIDISNLFWHERLGWSELKVLKAPNNLNFAWLRTKKSFYLFAKAELENYAELENLIGKYLPIES